jgi:general secretion pathway protein G
MMRTQKIRSRRAFTLLEVLMVVAILGLLAAAVAVVLTGTQERARRDITNLLIQKVGGAIERYNLHMNHYPREEDGGLRALLEQPSDAEQAKKWGGPYVEAKDLKDVWGNDLVYVCPGRVNTNSFDLSSYGKDGSESEDDITNWEKAP